MKRILFYPLYSGELGWELMVWQGFIRKAAEEFDEVHGVCFEPFKHLYEDFTDKLYFATPEERFTSPAHDTPKEVEKIIKELSAQEDVEVNVFDSRQTPPYWNHQEYAKYISYKEDVKKKYDAVLHLRQMKHREEDNGDSNWNVDLVKELVKEGKKVALIGTSHGTQDIDLPVDKFYDKPLSEVINVINKSKVVIGPSSGPMHLAALCEAEIVVWSHTTGDGLLQRYCSIWNPFKNKVNYLTKPTIKDIVGHVN